MLIHGEVAMHTDERWKKKCVSARETLVLCLVDIGGCGAHNGGPPERQMNSSWWVMWVSRPFRFNYELITRQDRGAGRWAGGWGGETKENNNWERTEGWKSLLKTLVEFRKHYKGGTSLLCEHIQSMEGWSKVGKEPHKSHECPLSMTSRFKCTHDFCGFDKGRK